MGTSKDEMILKRREGNVDEKLNGSGRVHFSYNDVISTRKLQTGQKSSQKSLFASLFVARRCASSSLPTQRNQDLKYSGTPSSSHARIREQFFTLQKKEVNFYHTQESPNDTSKAMKIPCVAVAALLALSSFHTTEAFGVAHSPLKHTSVGSTAFLKSSRPRQSIPRYQSSSDSNNNLEMNYKVGIVGATGAVGFEIRQVLEKRGFPVDQLRIFGSSRSAGSDVETEKYGTIQVELFDVAKARECDVVFLAVSGDFALEHAEAISAGDDGAVVIDNSSAFRYNPDVPLCVPEINGDKTIGSKLIANPNCTTAIGLMALWPLHKLFGLKKVIMTTYQAASGAGQPGMDELWEGTKAVVNGERDVAENSVFAHPLPFNVIPQIDKFQENGYTKEEMKVTWETRKICDLPDDFPVSCTAVRIPTSRAHSEVIIIETEKPVDLEAARKALDEAPGVSLVDDTENLKYPMPLTATGQYDIEVGRLRKSIVFDNGMEFFVSGDQLLRGAALNAVLVAEAMDKNGALQAKETA